MPPPHISQGCRADVDTLWKALDGEVVTYMYVRLYNLSAAAAAY